MERLKRRDATSPARDKIARCADMVFCDTARALAISPAASPSGSCFTSSRNTSSRVDWASAASARMASSNSIYLDLWIYYPLVKQIARQADSPYSGRPEQKKRRMGLVSVRNLNGA